MLCIGHHGTRTAEESGHFGPRLRNRWRPRCCAATPAHNILDHGVDAEDDSIAHHAQPLLQALHRSLLCWGGGIGFRIVSLEMRHHQPEVRPHGDESMPEAVALQRRHRAAIGLHQHVERLLVLVRTEQLVLAWPIAAGAAVAVHDWCDADLLEAMVHIVVRTGGGIRLRIGVDHLGSGIRTEEWVFERRELVAARARSGARCGGGCATAARLEFVDSLGPAWIGLLERVVQPNGGVPDEGQLADIQQEKKLALHVFDVVVCRRVGDPDLDGHVLA